MTIEPGKLRTANLILPFALFGFLAPIATYLVAVSNVTSGTKTVILSVLAGGYIVLFVISYKRLRASVNTGVAVLTSSPKLSSEYSESMPGLAGDKTFRTVLEHEVAECARVRDRALSLLAIEIRDYDLLVENNPSARGELLEFAADKIKGSLRAMDIPAYLDGPNFAVILPTADAIAAAEIARRIEESFAKHHYHAPTGENRSVRVFIGAATLSRSGDTAGSLIRQAIAAKRKVMAGSPQSGR